MEKLYHYTNFAALNGIIENAELWMCNAASMNDTKEIVHYIEAVKKSILNECPSKKEEIQALFDNYSKKYQKEDTYVTSFTTLKDDAAQWERYGDNASGVCIAFDRNKLKELCEIKGFIRLQTVYYSSKEFVCKNEHVGMLYDSLINETIENADLDGLFSNLYAAASSHKHPSFSSEHEIRLCSLPGLIDTVEIKLYNTGKGVKEYYPFLLKSNESNIIDCITEIIIAPRSSTTTNTLKKYIESLGYSFYITQSDCPLR